MSALENAARALCRARCQRGKPKHRWCGVRTCKGWQECLPDVKIVLESLETLDWDMLEAGTRRSCVTMITNSFNPITGVSEVGGHVNVRQILKAGIRSVRENG